jgi:hypothetical protein
LFKDFRNQHYREFIEDVGDMEGVQEILDLSEVPHFTTLQKFISRIKTLYLRFTFRKTVDLFYSSDENIPITALDSSGFTSGYCSHYFSERTGKIRKHFLKVSISVDTGQQVITGFVASNSRVHDTRHAWKLLPQCHKVRKSDCYVMDKGYDSEALHQLIREVIYADSVIPVRSWNNEIVGGTYRREMAQRFNDIIYPRRQLVETKFSVLKRKFGGDLKARKFRIQMKEIAIKIIVCNIHRFLLFFVLEVFYRAQKFGSKGNLSGLKEDNIREYREIQFEETKKIIEDEIRQLQLTIPSYAVNPNIPIYLKRQEYWNKECCASCLSCSDDDGRPLRCVKHNVKNHKNGCCDGYRYYNIQIPGK